MTLSDGVNTITLREDLAWVDRYTWAAVGGTVAYGWGGAVVIDRWRLPVGRPITLEATERLAWITADLVAQLATWNALPGLELILDGLRGEPARRVRIRHEDGGIALRPLRPDADQLPAAYWIGRIPLIEVAGGGGAGGGSAGGALTDLLGLPDPATLPEGAILQVMLGAWYVNISQGLAPVTSLPTNGLLPDASTLPDGATVQVKGTEWTVETAPDVWTGVSALARTDGLPDPAGHMDGALLEVADGAWRIAA